MEQHQVIDETFAGLSRPAQTFEMGRPDIIEDRPGSVLVAEVRAFEADGGFARIAEERDSRRAADEAADATPRPAKVRTTAYDIALKDSIEVPSLNASDD